MDIYLMTTSIQLLPGLYFVYVKTVSVQHRFPMFIPVQKFQVKNIMIHSTYNIYLMFLSDLSVILQGSRTDSGTLLGRILAQTQTLTIHNQCPKMMRFCDDANFVIANGAAEGKIRQKEMMWRMRGDDVEEAEMKFKHMLRRLNSED